MDRKLFLLEQHNLEQWQERHSDILTGVIQVTPNGTVHGDIDCGWRTNPSVFTSRPKHVCNHYPVLCPLLVSHSEYFQHFIDGALPKLLQLRSIIHFKGVKFFFRCRGIMWPYTMVVTLPTRLLDNACITPPLHPSLFCEAHMLIRGMAKKFGSSDELVILLTRDHAKKGGRRILKKDRLISYLRGRYGHGLYAFHVNLTFSDSIKLFRRVQLVVGVHGGAFYNTIFAPSSKNIAELMSTTTEVEVMPTYIGHTIFWAISDMLNQTNWRIISTPSDSLGNVKVDIKKIAKVLGKIDQK